jgi:hypothetical protein
MNIDKFKTVTISVIDLLEGGYFHPDMFLDGRVSTQFEEIYSKSGETMYGLDRFAGHDLFYSTKRKTNDKDKNQLFIDANVYVYKSNAARQFWTIIDNARARKNWKFNYRGGNNEQLLQNLTAEILYPVFIRLFNKYLDKKAQNIVENSHTLLFHFCYAVWNGEGFFKFYANLINSAVRNGITSDEELTRLINDARINSRFVTIRNTGQKILNFFQSITWIKLKKKLINQPQIPVVILITVALGAFLLKKRK